MVWENVPGAFSSNEAEDFRIVLQETARIKEPDAVIPQPPKGKWTTSGCIMGDGWSIAWRVLDAQFWGVPQRRRRIALVADFGGQSAPEILFVRKGVSGDIEQSKPQRKETASDTARGSGADDRTGATDRGRQLDAVGLTNRGFISGDVAETCRAESHGALPLVRYAVDQGGGKSEANNYEDVLPTLTCTHGGEPAIAYTVMKPILYQNVVGSLCASDHKGVGSQYVDEDKCVVCYGIGSYHSNAWKSDNPHSGVYEADTAKTLDALNCGYPGCNQGGIAIVEPRAVDCRNGTEDEVNDALQSNSAHSLNGNNVVRTRYIVRRLTPLECERLQGYPDGWTDIGEYTETTGKTRKSSDAARYKALGNSIALPPWKWVMKRISACYERDATLASLFDGIGGFPLIWEQINGKGSCLWASEIEEFPIAVTKKRIG
jgi:DNA (cytosine-5)-methyltransferase 1